MRGVASVSADQVSVTQIKLRRPVRARGGWTGERGPGRGGPVSQTKKAGRHFEVNELSASVCSFSRVSCYLDHCMTSL